MVLFYNIGNMTKQIIFTAVLVIICVASFIVGLKPVGPLAAWQEKAPKPKTEAKPVTKPEVKVEEVTKWITIKIQWKSIHQSLNEKTDQFLKAWGTLKTVQGNVNILHATNVTAVYPAANPLEVLAPVNNVLTKVSNLSRWALTVLLLEKMLLVISVPLVCLILIPICMLIAIYHVWNYKDKKNLHRVVITAVMICAVILLAVPLTLKVSTIIDSYVFTGSVDSVMATMGEIDKSAASFNNELKWFRRSEAAISGYLSTANKLSDAVIKEALKYLLIFLMINIIIPVLLFIILYKATRYYIKKILKR